MSSYDAGNRSGGRWQRDTALTHWPCRFSQNTIQSLVFARWLLSIKFADKFVALGAFEMHL